MTAPHIVDPARLLDQAVSDASPDLMRHLLSTVINALLSAEADAVVRRRVRPGLTGPARPNATATDTATWTPGRARSTSRSRSCARGRTSRTGCSSAASGPSRR